MTSVSRSAKRDLPKTSSASRMVKPVAPAGQVYTAVYRDHPVERYNSNALIRVLDVLQEPEEMQARLSHAFKYSESERELPRSVKNLQLEQLSKLYLAFPRVIELAETIHAMVCEGYLGRAPFSEGDFARRQRAYDLDADDDAFDDDEKSGAEYSAALIGIPGIGKSRAIKRVLAKLKLSRVIYHPELDIHQIPALLIEMPYKGNQLNVLAHSIIRAIDKLYPQGNYVAMYLRGKPDAEVLFMDAVNLMQIHYVGILIVDESQNKDYRKRLDSMRKGNEANGQTPLTTLLINASNTSQIPLLLTGTPELRDIMAVRMSMARRGVGHGLRLWKPLSLPRANAQGEVTDMGEFDVFLHVLWGYQWTKTPFELTQRMRNLFYYYTQGISDVVIKLFHCVQLRAIRDGGDEIVDEALVHDVANDELKAMTELTAAMRDLDYDRMGKAADLAAYMRLRPDAETFNRVVKPMSAEEGAEEPEGDDEVETDEAPPEEAFEQPKEVKTGAKARRPRRPKASATASESAQPLPDMKAVDDLDDVFGAD